MERHTNIFDKLNMDNVLYDAAVGFVGLDSVPGGYVRIIMVRSANEFTIPLSSEVSQEDVLRLAAAVTEWDADMMEQAEAPFDNKGPAVPARQVIRGFLPCMYRCEFRDLFVDTYGYAGVLL